MLVYAVDNAKALARLDYVRVGLVIVQVKGRGRVSKAGLDVEPDGPNPLSVYVFEWFGPCLGLGE